VQSFFIQAQAQFNNNTSFLVVQFLGSTTILLKMISYGETKEDKSTGMAYPPDLFDDLA